MAPTGANMAPRDRPGSDCDDSDLECDGAGFPQGARLWLGTALVEALGLHVGAMLAYRAWLVGSKSQSPAKSGVLRPEIGPKTSQQD